MNLLGHPERYETKMKKTKTTQKDNVLDGHDIEIEMSLLQADEKEQEEREEELEQGKCIDAPKDKTRCVICVRMGVTEFTNNPRAHRRTIQYMEKVLAKSYQSQIVQITSSTSDECVQACLFVKKTCAIPLCNAVRDNTFLQLMNDTYLMYLRHPNKEINPQRLDIPIRLAKKAESDPKFACCMLGITPYVRAYDTFDMVHITCAMDLIPFDGDKQLRNLLFPGSVPQLDGAVTNKSTKKKKKQKQHVEANDKLKDDIISYLSNETGVNLSYNTDDM